MIRREVLQAKGGYNTAYSVAEDYDLWLRISETSSLANLAEPLIFLRKHGAQVTKTKSNNITMYRVSAVMDHFLRKYDAPSEDLLTEGIHSERIAEKILTVYELQPTQEDLRAINANAIRFFRKATLNRQTSEKLDAAITASSNVRERFKHLLYKAGL
jgi:hypothetical protein